ncbi:MAG: hypothetical protein Q6373_007230 [Candidatus Sigynarchaeota archaeon]
MLPRALPEYRYQVVFSRFVARSSDNAARRLPWVVPEFYLASLAAASPSVS